MSLASLEKVAELLGGEVRGNGEVRPFEVWIQIGSTRGKRDFRGGSQGSGGALSSR